MKLVSVDVGLRNLAVCVLEGTSRSDVKILHWEVIDVMAESVGLSKPLCYKCKKSANWVNNGKYACKPHTTTTAKLPTKKSLNQKSTEELQQTACASGLKGNTKKELVDSLYQHYKNNTWARCVKSTKQVSVVDLADPIAKALESRRSIWKDADLIAFEQQPDKRMLCVQAMLHMWFVCQGFRCKGVSATHKLTNIVTLQDSTKTYKGRKNTGIIHAQELVKDNKWNTFMMKHPKKDDLADCYLQGVWLLEH
jgi:hypothetical protein